MQAGGAAHCPPGAVTPGGRDVSGRLERRYIEKIKAGRSFNGDPQARQMFEDRLDEHGNWLSFDDWRARRAHVANTAMDADVE